MRPAAKAFAESPQVRRFTDFRAMFDALEKQIDGVVISTPDQMHFHPAWWALERGKHVYLEKPVGHEVEEVRRLTEGARKRGLATQLGVQRHAPRAGRWIAADRGGTLADGACLADRACLPCHPWLANAGGVAGSAPVPSMLTVGRIHPCRRRRAASHPSVRSCSPPAG